MKKLIALFVCVCAAVAVAQANGLSPKAEQALNAQVDKSTRVVQLTVGIPSSPSDFAIGKALIVSSTGNKMLLLTSQSLAIDIDDLGDEPDFARVHQDKKQIARGVIKKIWADNPGVNQHFYTVTIQGTNFPRFPEIQLSEARKLLK